MSIDKPSPWIIAREEREYELAHEIVVLSTFAHRTMVERPRLKSKTLLRARGRGY